MNKQRYECFMRLATHLNITHYRILNEVFGKERLSMSRLYRDAIEYYLDDQLNQYGRNINRCAAMLGISAKTLYRMMHKRQQANRGKGSAKPE
jgi:DNA-binding NtrC family response regulator